MNFVFDLDGTLLNDQSQIPELTWKWLQKLKTMNHKLYLNTGRPYEAITSGLKNQVKIFDGIASYNGSQINLDHQTSVLSLDPKLVFALKKQFSNHNFATTISLGEDLYVDDQKKASDIIYRLSPKTIFPLTKLGNQKIFSIRLVFENAKTAEAFYQEAKNKLADYNVVMSTQIYVLITDKKATKELLINQLKAQSDDLIIFFGDSQNDLCVFKMPKVFKVAPQNAVPEIKKLANLILPTTNNQSLAFDLNIFKKL